MLWYALLLCLPALAQTANDPAKELDVSASAQWIDTGVDLRAGDALQFTTTGTLNLGGGRSTGPQGAQRGFRDLIKAYPVNEAGLGALIGRIGSSDAAVPFLIGAGRQIQVPRAGRLFLSVNKTSSDSPDGSFHVKVEFATRGPEVSATPVNYKLAEVTTEMIDRIPRRVTDAQGNAGDNTNFVVVGNEEKVVQTFEAAGWVKVDREKKDAVLHTILSTFTKQAYVELPMSELTLFGRVQDYGLAHAVPIQVVAQRHHLRLWKAPFQVEGQELWVGAATHDIGFDRDNRNNGVTHKIDPNVDDEREFVGRSLDETGLVAKLSYVTPSQASKEARTATGATFHSDGRVMVVHLIPASAAAAMNSGAADVKFANLFVPCERKRIPMPAIGPGASSFCKTAPQARVDLAPLASKYRVLIVPGFFQRVQVFHRVVWRRAGSHAQPARHDSGNLGASQRFVGGQWRGHRPVFARPHDDGPAQIYRVGLQQGAPDVQTALALLPEAKDAVAAFIAVAGAMGGSPIADLLRARANGWIQRFKLAQ